MRGIAHAHARLPQLLEQLSLRPRQRREAPLAHPLGLVPQTQQVLGLGVVGCELVDVEVAERASAVGCEQEGLEGGPGQRLHQRVCGDVRPHGPQRLHSRAECTGRCTPDPSP